MEEIWKPIPSLPGYEASSEGNIRSVDRVLIYKNRLGEETTRHCKGKLLKQRLTKKGYCVVGITIKGEPYPYRVSRLVAEAFFGISKLDVDHINRDKTDNRVCNLRYLSNEENAKNRSNRNKVWDPTFETYV